jgi:hypothetical protein
VILDTSAVTMAELGIVVVPFDDRRAGAGDVGTPRR